MADEELIEEEVVVAPAITPDPAALQLDEWGDVIQTRPGQETGTELGRAVDLGFLGDAAQDPVTAGQDAIQDIARTGTLGGYDLDAIRQSQSGISPFPDAPGTSAAAAGSYELAPSVDGAPREFALDPETGRRIPILNEAGEVAQESLPEMFTGKTKMNPQYEALSQRLDNPALTFFERVGLMGALKDMEGQETYRAPSGMGAGLDVQDKALISAAAMTMFDPSEVAQMLVSVDPETGERKWPQFSMQHAPDGTVIMNNSINGAQSMINAPGMSKMDVLQGLGIAAAFTPAGRATAAVKATIPRMMVGAGTAGLTETAIQAAHEASGGQFDNMDVALSAGLGPLIDTVRPLIGFGQRAGKFIGSYIPTTWTRGMGEFVEKHTEGLKGVIPAVRNEVIEFSEKAADWLKSGRPAKVMTEDAVPEMHSPRMKILLKMAERMFLTGTGGIRTAQREQRVEVLRHVADRFGVDPVTNYGAKVLKELGGDTGDALYAARQMADEGAQAMADNPELKINIRDFRFKMRDLIAAEEKYGELADPTLLKVLNEARNAVWQGGKEQDFARGFGQLSDWLQRLRVEASSGKPAVRASLNEVADALEADLIRTAQEQGGEAGQNWLTGLAKERQLFEAAQGKSLKAVIASGEVDSAVIERVMRSGRVDDIQLLRDNLGQEGIEAAQAWILHDALRFAGWRRSAANEALVSPSQFLKYMEGDAVEGQVRTFFPENEFNGMLEYLKMTAQVEQLGKGVGMAAAGGFGTLGANAVNLATLGVAGLLGHSWQSAPVRNLFLRLYHIGPDVRAKDAIMKQITPLLMAGGRQTLQDWNANDPQGKTYLSDEYLEQLKEEGNEPDDKLMQQLRDSFGGGDPVQEDAPGVGERLQQMIEEAEEGVIE